MFLTLILISIPGLGSILPSFILVDIERGYEHECPHDYYKYYYAMIAPLVFTSNGILLSMIAWICYLNRDISRKGWGYGRISLDDTDDEVSNIENEKIVYRRTILGVLLFSSAITMISSMISWVSYITIHWNSDCSHKYEHLYDYKLVLSLLLGWVAVSIQIAITVILFRHR